MKEKDEKVLKHSFSAGSILFQKCDEIKVPKSILKNPYHDTW